MTTLAQVPVNNTEELALEEEKKELIYEYFLSMENLKPLKEWNNYALSYPISNDKWIRIRTIIDSFQLFAQECSRIMNTEEPGFLDDSLYTFYCFLDNKWSSILFDNYARNAHNLVLEFCNFVGVRLNGLLIENLYEARITAESKIVIENKNINTWSINHYFDNYIKQICLPAGMTKSRYGYYLETYPFHCVRELCKHGVFEKIMKFKVIVEIVLLSNKLMLFLHPELNANIAGYDKHTPQDLDPILHRSGTRSEAFDFLNFTTGLELLDRDWLDAFFDMDVIQSYISVNELKEILNNPYKIYFETLDWFLNEVLADLVVNRVHAPILKKLKDGIKPLEKKRLNSDTGQQPYIRYFEENLIFNFLNNSNNKPPEATPILILFNGPRTKALQEVCKLLDLDPVMASRLSVNSINYLVELYKVQYYEIYPPRIDTQRLSLSNVNTIADNQQESIYHDQTPNRFLTNYVINPDLFVFTKAAIDYNAFCRPAVRRSFEEVVRVLTNAQTHLDIGDNVLDKFISMVIFPEIHGQSASLLRHKVSMFYANSSRVQIGDIEIKLSEEHRLFLREDVNDYKRVQIVELSNPRYHH